MEIESPKATSAATSQQRVSQYTPSSAPVSMTASLCALAQNSSRHSGFQA